MTLLALLAAHPAASMPASLILAGIEVFGISINPAIFAFLLVIGGWGLLNFLEYRRFD